MKNALTESPVFPVCRWLGLSVLALLVPLAMPAAESNGASPKPALRFNPVQWGTNADWKIPGEFHDIDFDSIPLGEVVKHLQQLYHDEFDVLIPNSISPSEAGAIKPATGLPETVEGLDARDLPVRMRLKNVTAPEVFRAMNMLFEMDRTPARWDLILFSSRPVAVLRPVAISRPVPPLPLPGTPILPSFPAIAAPHTSVQTGVNQPPPAQRLVLYIGDLTGDPGAGGMTLESILRTLTATLEESFSPARSKLQCHAAAELLIVTGPAEECAFVTEVLAALKQKVNAERERKARSSVAEPQKDHPRP